MKTLKSINFILAEMRIYYNRINRKLIIIPKLTQI